MGPDQGRAAEPAVSHRNPGRLFCLSVAWAMATVSAVATRAAAPAADLLIEHARVWSGNPAQPEAQAVAVWNGRIVAVGSDAQVSAWRGANTEVVDAQSKRLLPGFNDAHVHFSDGGASLHAVQL